jgi:hypothetical protein
MYRELSFESLAGLIPKIAGERHLDPLEDEDAHRLGEPWKPRRRLRHRHSWTDDELEEGI